MDKARQELADQWTVELELINELLDEFDGEVIDTDSNNFE